MIMRLLASIRLSSDPDVTNSPASQREDIQEFCHRLLGALAR